MGSQRWYPDALLECEPIGFWHVDVASMRSKLDPSMSALFCIDPAAGEQGVEAARMLCRIHPDDRAKARPALLAAIEQAGLHYYRYRVLEADGAYRWVQARGRCYTDEAGRPTHVVGILTEDVDASALPIEVPIIELLMKSLDLAKHGGDPVLPRLIEAVLLHAGREIAKSVDQSSLT